MVHLFNALILLLFVSIGALFSNMGKPKDKEAFSAVLTVYHTDSVLTVGPRYLDGLRPINTK